VRSSIFCFATNTFQGNQPSPYSREHCGCSFRYLLFSKPCSGHVWCCIQLLPFIYANDKINYSLPFFSGKCAWQVATKAMFIALRVL